jgi:hypothetical protein
MGDNIKMDVREMGSEHMDWIHLAHNSPVVDFCEYDNKPLGCIEAWNLLNKLFKKNPVLVHFQGNL